MTGPPVDRGAWGHLRDPPQPTSLWEGTPQREIRNRYQNRRKAQASPCPERKLTGKHQVLGEYGLCVRLLREAGASWAPPLCAHPTHLKLSGPFKRPHCVPVFRKAPENRLV